MSAILWSWAVSAALLLVLAVVLGSLVKLAPGPLSVLVDGRGRYSLNHVQLVVWSIVVISLVSGVFFGRLIDGVHEPLQFTIPDRVLGLLGISLGAGVTVGAVKANKSAIALKAEAKAEKPTLASYKVTQRLPFIGQIFMLEEGEYADQVVDVTKFQGFGITIVLVVAYVAMAISTIADAKTAAAVTALPDISGTFLVLLGISYAGYTAGKLPTNEGTPPAAAPGP